MRTMLKALAGPSFNHEVVLVWNACRTMHGHVHVGGTVAATASITCIFVIAQLAPPTISEPLLPVRKTTWHRDQSRFMISSSRVQLYLLDDI